MNGNFPKIPTNSRYSKGYTVLLLDMLHEAVWLGIVPAVISSPTAIQAIALAYDRQVESLDLTGPLKSCICQKYASKLRWAEKKAFSKMYIYYQLFTKALPAQNC